MAETKKRILILFGGRSSEHEISCVTATGILGALDKETYEAVCVGITKQGSFVHLETDSVNYKLDPENMPVVEDNGTRVLWPRSADSNEFRLLDGAGNISSLGTINAVFPVLHGPFGEDGTIQGMLELFGMPYVGSGVLASSVCMDKHVAKTMLQAAGVSVAPWNVLTRAKYSAKEYSLGELTKGLNYPLFIKPSRAGSSVGVSRVTAETEMEKALKIAFAEDKTVLIEEGVAGREIEIAALQGRNGRSTRTSTVVGEIVFQGKDFYDYEAKYLGSDGVKLELPANVSEKEFNSIQAAAVAAYDALQCAGPARVDFFLTEDGPVLNEINTMPGFTPISMYPQLWENSGVSYAELVSELIELAFETER